MSGEIFLVGKIAPKNAAFVGMVDASQVIGGSGNTLPDDAVAVGNVTQHATATPTAGAIPLADGSGKLDDWVTAGIGDDGADGATWLVGAGAPDNGNGVDGDLYLNTTNQDVYRKVTGSWGSAICNIKGATGAAGTNGTNGTNGSQGIQGIQGIQGPAGPGSSAYTAALSWSGAGPYTMAIAAATHGKGTNPLVVVRETTGGTSVDVQVNVSVADASGDVTLTSTFNPTGKVLVI